MVSLKFSCTLAEHMLCSCGQLLGGAHQHLSGEFRRFCLENETQYDCRSYTCPQLLQNIFLCFFSFYGHQKKKIQLYSETQRRKESIFLKRMVGSWREGKKERRECSFADLKSICFIKPKSNCICQSHQTQSLLVRNKYFAIGLNPIMSQRLSFFSQPEKL